MLSRQSASWASLPFSDVREGLRLLAPGENILQGKASPRETTPLLTIPPCLQTAFPLFPDGS